MKQSKLTIFILILFFFSGLASLIYEVIWAKKLGLIFGGTSYATSTILAVFMAGLALGSFLFGKIVDRLREPKKLLFLVALLGIGEGAYAIFTPFIFELINKIQLVLVGNFSQDFSTLNMYLLRFGLCFLALILPTTLSGGTLPVLSKLLVRLKEDLGKKIALLYSLNTFGGMVGITLAGFFLIIPLGFGVNGTIYAAGAIDILVGLIFLRLYFNSKTSTSFLSLKKEMNEEIDERRRGETSEKTTGNVKLSYLLLIIFFFTGFTALALEVLWTRVLVLTIGSSTYAFSLILAGFLSGIALGSILIAKFVDKIKNLWLVLAVTIGLIGVFAILLTPLFDDLPFLFLKIFGIWGESFWKFEMAIFSLIFFVLLIPTILMGITFPLGIKLYIKDIRKIGGSLGEIYSVNTLGAIFGSIFAGFLFLPSFGLQKSILICALIYFFLAAAILLITSQKILFKTIFILVIIALGISSFGFPQWNKYVLTSGPAVYAKQYLLRPETIYGDPEKETIIFYKDGVSASVAVSQTPKGFLAMRVDGKVDASAGRIEFKEIGDLDTMYLTGYLPLLLHPKKPQNALIVGLGSGVTLGAMSQYPLKEIDLIEIEPAVVEGAEYFKEFNHNALSDARLKIIIEDGRNYLLISTKKYDIISSQPSNPWVKGNANLFTKEYYTLAKNRLSPEGLMLQWVQLYSLDGESLKTILNTFSEVFPYVQVWSSPSYKDLFLIGSLEPIRIDDEQFEKRFNIPEIKTDFQKVGILEAEEILSRFIFTQNQIKNLSKDSKLHTDNYPILEFRAPFYLYRDTVSTNLEKLYSFEENVKDLFGIEISQEVKDFQENSLLAVISKEKGDSEQTINFYERALGIRKNPVLEGELSKLYYGKGKLAALNGRIDEALSFYQRAVSLNPQEPIFLNSLGVTYFKKDDFENAEVWFKRATEIGSWHTWSFSNLGLLYARQGKNELAEDYLKKALEIKEDNTDALNWLAIVYYNKGMRKEVEELLKKSLEINPDQPKVKERLKELLK